jgi:quercetin dioxygenase-like cupin family protein
VAHAGQQVENPATGERIVFARIEDEVVEMIALWTTSGRRTGPHLHPQAEERWEVIEGRAAFRIDGAEHDALPGDVVVAAPGVPHEAWNPGPDEARVRIELRPALRWPEFVERLFAGESPAALLEEFRDEIRLA